MEYGVEPFGFIVNHKVEYTHGFFNSQPNGCIFLGKEERERHTGPFALTRLEPEVRFYFELLAVAHKAELPA